MTWLRRCGRRLRGAFSRFGDRAVREKVDLHLDLLAEEFRDQGFSELEARRRAERAFGNRTRTVELTRAVTTLPWLESLLNDIVYGARQLRRSPAVTILAIASLAIGIGANSAVFSIVDALVLRSLPVPAPDRLAALSLGDHDAKGCFLLKHGAFENRVAEDAPFCEGHWAHKGRSRERHGSLKIPDIDLANEFRITTVQIASFFF